MEERTVTITLEEYKNLIKDSLKLQMISEHVGTERWIDAGFVKVVLGIEKEGE